MISNYFKGIWRDRYILWSFVSRDLQLKYKKSLLGVAWSIITPLGLVLIIGCVYSILFGVDPKSFIPLLFAGINPWIFISGSAEGGTFAYINAEGYLKQTTVSPQIFPIRVVMVNFINLLYSIIAFFSIYLFIEPNLIGSKMLMVFPGLIIIFVFSVAWANIASVVNLHLRDFQPLQSLILQGLFYATPIIFQTTMLDEKGFSIIYKINPIYYVLEVVRMPMLGNEIPSINVYLTAIIISTLSFVYSIRVVMKNSKGIALKL